MKDIENNTLPEKDNAFHSIDVFFENIDLNKDLEELYEALGDYENQTELEKNTNLNILRNENHKRYYEIDTLKYENLPDELCDAIEDMFDLYSYIDAKKILTADEYESNKTKLLLDNIYRRINRLDRMVKTCLNDITKTNDEKQSKFSFNYFNSLDISEPLKKDLITKYNDLVLLSSNVFQDIYDDLKLQTKRKNYINEILKLLNLEENKKINIKRKDRLKVLNRKIEEEIFKYKQQIQYLEDIMPDNSKHLKEFEAFKDFCNKLMAYDDESYENAKQTFEILCDELKFKAYVSNFEELFVQEIADKQKEEEFIYEKVGLKNLKKSLDYITANYMDKIGEELKSKVEYIFNQLNSNNYDLNELNKELSIIVRNIWSNTITNVYEYNPSEDYYFICSNNQFIDAKNQTILITRREINRVQDYGDYQIGFICGYNDNIMYITENDDIMSVSDIDDMSNLKTPLQLEQEFINFKVCNRIALNGFKTTIEAVYYINDGNIDKYMKAVELANMYKLPLIEIKKDNYL